MPPIASDGEIYIGLYEVDADLRVRHLAVVRDKLVHDREEGEIIFGIIYCVLTRSDHVDGKEFPIARVGFKGLNEWTCVRQR